jgi:hypothetical protein
MPSGAQITNANGAWRDGPQLTNNGFFRTAFVLNGQEASPASAPVNQGRWWRFFAVFSGIETRQVSPGFWPPRRRCQEQTRWV